MSATPFTRRKFLISTAAAASSAWFLAACSGGEPDTPAAAPQSPAAGPSVRDRHGDGHRHDVDVLDLGA